MEHRLKNWFTAIMHDHRSCTALSALAALRGIEMREGYVAQLRKSCATLNENVEDGEYSDALSADTQAKLLNYLRCCESYFHKYGVGLEKSINEDKLACNRKALHIQASPCLRSPCIWLSQLHRDRFELFF